MRFFVRKRRSTPTVIIVALIDVLIVLLIFLLATTSFKQQQSAVPITLPESSQSQKTGGNENPPLIVSVDAKGIVRMGEDALPVTDDRLKEELLARVQKNPELRMAISADESAPWGRIMKVRDAAAAAKIKYLFAYVKEVPKP
jgi:biopolymer transport protein ExbD